VDLRDHRGPVGAEQRHVTGETAGVTFRPGESHPLARLALFLSGIGAPLRGPVEAGPGVRELCRSEAQVDLVAPDGVHVGRVARLERPQHQPLGRHRDPRERAIGRHRTPRIPASSAAA
jgi:hypothetical protein